MTQTPDPQRALPHYPIESVDRALRLLAMLGATREIRLSDARDALGVGQSTAHRLMAMLVYHGFAAQDPLSRAYRAGPALVEIGLSAVRQLDLRSVARPVMQTLAAETGETIHVGLLEQDRIRYLDTVESSHALRVGGRVGRLSPAHATSMGKAILARLDDRQVLALYPGRTLERVTDRTTARRADLLAELQEVRRTGYAVNLGESEEGVTSVGAAIMHPGGGPVGGLSIAAPLSRMTRQKREIHAALLVEGCAKITVALG
ncbi:IclR family transcriptional regulator [Nonomuraea sp. NPDC050394]|uniref:IclR family transcriptional regulator n=1 Tax=Nonomuraea sp. NPDC050394 TaxID=3364363 RepID=UPI0037A7A9B2